MDQIRLLDDAAFRQLIARHKDRIRHVFFGHCHLPLAGSVAGVPRLVAARHQPCELPAVLRDQDAERIRPAGVYGVVFFGEDYVTCIWSSSVTRDRSASKARPTIRTEPGDHGAMKFVILTDTHFVARGRKIYGLDPAERLAAAIEVIIRDHRDLAFVIVTGDLAHWGEDAAYETSRTCSPASTRRPPC